MVFGCGGDRDRTKRPRMARVAAGLADRVVVTSDNPRSEDPQAIIEEILAGLDESGRAKTVVQADRRAAIAQAIDQARPGDIVLIAGKGHETYQIIGDRRIHFDDAEVAAGVHAGHGGAAMKPLDLEEIVAAVGGRWVGAGRSCPAIQSPPSPPTRARPGRGNCSSPSRGAVRRPRLPAQAAASAGCAAAIVSAQGRPVRRRPRRAFPAA